MVDACHPAQIPTACLFEHGKAVWHGDVADAGAVLETWRTGKLADWLASDDTIRQAADTKLTQALSDPAEIAEVVAIMHGRPGWENDIAWPLVDRRNSLPNEVALAIALSRDAAIFDGGLDFSQLDTYALALAKAGRAADAAYVGERVIAVCAAIHGSCADEKERALAYIERAGGKQP
jgi:hypothetical protein